MIPGYMDLTDILLIKSRGNKLSIYNRTFKYEHRYNYESIDSNCSFFSINKEQNSYSTQDNNSKEYCHRLLGISK